MRIDRFFLITLLVASGACLLASSPARGAQVKWDVVGERSASPLLDISDADLLLGGKSVALTNVVAAYATINFNEPDRPLGGLFSGDVAFPGTSIGHETDFAMRATAYLKIPAAGHYTFGVSSDDGFSLTVGTHQMSFPGLRYPGQSYSTFDFPKAGAYPVTLTFFEHQIAAEAELFATPGTYTAFKQPGSNFELVGDVVHGGLELVNIPAVGAVTPEPTGVLVMFIPLLSVLLRRK
jgi:hypothetical protein